jgi:hypothetical protein
MNERLSVPDAAKRLGISEGALRQRINRGTIEHEKDADGRVYVFVQDTHGEQYGEQYGDVGQVVEILREQNVHLREQLDQEREANRENRRLLAAALERIPALEAPPEPRESSETVSEEPGRGTAPDEGQGQHHPVERPSWWRRFFGFE